MTITVVAIDPGFTTGYAVAKLHDNREFELQAVGELTWEERFKLGELINAAEQVIIEDFRLYEHAKNNQVNSFFPSVIVIGIVECFCYLQGSFEREIVKEVPVDVWVSKPLKKQMASVMQNVSILPKDKHWVEASEHRGDAIKHLRYFALTRGRK